jgi:hypothetical protein
MTDSNNKFKNFSNNNFIMAPISSSEDPHKAIKGEDLVEKMFEEIKKRMEKRGIERLLMEFNDLKYDYESRVEDTRLKILKNAPKAAEAYEILVKELEKWSGCKSFSTNDQETLYQCIGKYFFMKGIIDGIEKYTVLYAEFLSEPGELKKFINDLKTLADKQVREDLYRHYQEVKEQKLRYLSEFASTYNHPVSQEKLIPESYEIASQFVEDLIFRHLKDHKGLNNNL